ncbi:MAG: EFR1 family ferrodoxin, partial [Ruminococcus sp.]|nr:EFR1 family ferrodoxin [Ruminococcus sp.]
MTFYFTATENSLYIAKELDNEIISIPQVLHKDSLCFESEKIGIVCPVYGHEMPKMVKEFIRKVTFKTDYFYVILTYGALHGGAAEIADKYIKSVGKKADYIKSIVMVDNFLPNFDMEAQ